MMVMDGRPKPPETVVGEAASLPVTFTAGLPTLELKINGHGPFKLAFDTGAPGGPHLTARLASALGLEPAGQVMVGDPSGKQGTPVNLYRLESVGFGSVSAKGWMATGERTRLGKTNTLDGVVGLDAFGGYVVTIDYPHRRFRLRRGALPAADGKAVFSYVGPMAPAVPLTLESRTILAHVDTGNTVAGVIVPSAFAGGLRHGREATVSGLAQTTSGKVQMFSVRIEGEARVGATPLAVWAVRYPSIIPVANIGSLALVHTVIEIDPSHERIRISPAT
jgi:hypothetical protein